MRVIGDLTLNHTGDGARVVRAAQADPSAPERGFYYFDDSLPHGYAAWCGIRSLPKLNHGSPRARAPRWREVARALARAAVRARRLADRRREHGRPLPRSATSTHEVARDARRARGGQARRAARRRARPRLPRRPARRRLARDDELRRLPAPGLVRGCTATLPGRARSAASGASRSGCATARTAPVRRRRCARSAPGVPGTSILHSWALLDSHDSARFRDRRGLARARSSSGSGCR